MKKRQHFIFVSELLFSFVCFLLQKPYQCDTSCRLLIIYVTNTNHQAVQVSWQPVSRSQSISHLNQHISREGKDDRRLLAQKQ